MNFVGVSFSMCCFLFNLLLVILFFGKKRLINIETKIYSYLLIITFIMTALSLPIYFATMYHSNLGVFADIISKSYLVFITLWLTFLDVYFLYITNHKIDEKKYLDILKKCSIVYYILILVFIIVLPIKYSSNVNEIYTYGPAVNVSFIVGLIADTIFIYCLIREIHYSHKSTAVKVIQNKKFFPLFSMLIIGATSAILQKINPSWLFMTTTVSIVIHIMYFTIENPDMKMIEQLNIARDQADKANQAKSDFLSSMSHEIRTPLNAIVGFSQALQEEDLPLQAQDEVKDIVRASESLLELVNGILDISKIEANKIEIVDGEYNIYDILNDLVALTKARMGDKPLEFKTYFDPSMPQVLYGDATRIKQVILNLLTNSVKYTKEGSIIFRVSSIQNEDVCRLIVSVEDTGIGIKKESIDKLFTKFQRFDLEKNRTIEGTGLGLAITKKLIELMNGRIMVQSVYGKGSKFTVALDQKIIHKVAIEKPKEEVKDDIVDLSGKKILIVDDNKLNLKVASRLLEKYNCSIETLESGFECIDKIKNNEQYDLILMDDMMPEMSGVETLHKLKEIENFNIPVVALTANAITGMKEKYLSEGFVDYLSKPIDKIELNKLLQKLLKN